MLKKYTVEFDVDLGVSDCEIEIGAESEKDAIGGAFEKLRDNPFNYIDFPMEPNAGHGISSCEMWVTKINGKDKG